MGLSSFNRARERQQMTEAKINELEEQLATLKGEFIAFQNDPEAMKARIAELELGAGKQNPEGDNQQAQDNQNAGDDQVQPINYAGLKVDELKAVLAEKGIAFESGAKKDELLALIPKE
ncbi:TPA: HeH/LEM domain protein [Acinetobacter baumannii]|uniref:HeH/LEM domain protein n=1 Tax=Acinetobacter baumannii (strain 1295743) TaxID=1310613 RepID=A0A009IA11_ACIB9|nr:HeH/LEM domain-containing protein [Acinetobacter baumannii]EXB07246.1 heH/LEM domain protein [Acinetobacter baumannii 1295743]HEO1793692.1 HeH/LEM domain protein [Acinetobacter baumannii]